MQLKSHRGFKLRSISIAIALLAQPIVGATFAPNAWADPNIRGIPDFQLEHPSNSLPEFILGPTCLSMVAGPMDLDCNPAFLATEKKRQFRADVSFNDKVKQVNDYREKVESGDSAGIADSILGNRDPNIAQASTALWYQRDWLAVGYVPIRAGLATLVQNQAYPDISADVYKESEFFAKAGYQLPDDPHVKVGLQARYVQRDYFYKEFAAFDAASDPSIIAVQQQKILFLEPGVSYVFDGDWASAISGTVTNLPIYAEGSTPFEPVFDVGFSTTPPFADGKFRTSTHITENPEIQDFFKIFRWGAIYDFDTHASVSMSIAKDEFGVGVNGHIESLVLGVGYKTQQISSSDWDSSQVSTYLFEAGLVF